MVAVTDPDPTIDSMVVTKIMTDLANMENMITMTMTAMDAKITMEEETAMKNVESTAKALVPINEGNGSMKRSTMAVASTAACSY